MKNPRQLATTMGPMQGVVEFLEGTFTGIVKFHAARRKVLPGSSESYAGSLKSSGWLDGRFRRLVEKFRPAHRFRRLVKKFWMAH